MIEGAANVDEVIDIIRTRYSSISRGVLWNMSAGSNSNLTHDDMRRIAMAAREHAVHDKTAYFGSVDLEFGMFRMYQTHAELEHVRPVMKVFRDRDEAIQWLMEPIA